jgi:hypothetical protein
MRQAFLSGLFLFLVSFGHARGLYSGVKAGLNYSGFHTNDVTSGYVGRTGFIAGFTFDYITKKNWLLGTGLSYEQRGYQHYEADDCLLDYVTLPLRLGYASAGQLYGDFAVGVIPGIVVAKNTAGSEAIGDFDLSLSVEGAIGYRIADRYVLFLEARYLEGLTAFSTIGIYGDAKYRLVSLSAGCKMQLKSR